MYCKNDVIHPIYTYPAGDLMNISFRAAAESWSLHWLEELGLPLVADNVMLIMEGVYPDLCMDAITDKLRGHSVARGRELLAVSDWLSYLRAKQYYSNCPRVIQRFKK